MTIQISLQTNILQVQSNGNEHHAKWKYKLHQEGQGLGRRFNPLLKKPHESCMCRREPGHCMAFPKGPTAHTHSGKASRRWYNDQSVGHTSCDLRSGSLSDYGIDLGLMMRRWRSLTPSVGFGFFWPNQFFFYVTISSAKKSDGYFFLYSLKYLLLYGLLLDNLNEKCGQAEWGMVLSISLKEMHPFKCFLGGGRGGEL